MWLLPPVSVFFVNVGHSVIYVKQCGRDTSQRGWWVIRSPGSNRLFWSVATESCLLPPCRELEQCGRLFPHGTRCIIDGWLIGNSITQRLLGWQTLGHRYPVRKIELEHRSGGKVSFRDASLLAADLLGMWNGHSLVHPLTDDLPSNRRYSWRDSAAKSRPKLITGEPVSGQCGCTFCGWISSLPVRAHALACVSLDIIRYIKWQVQFR